MARTGSAFLALALMVLAPVHAPAQDLHDRTGRGPTGSVTHPFVPAPPPIQPRIPGFAPAPPMSQPNVQGFPVLSHRPSPDRERHDRNRFLVPTVIYAAPPPEVSYGAPAYDSNDAFVYAPAPGYDAPVTYGAPVTTDVEPMPSVIEYPTGRYELRGDGISTPHTWVWIPNPPPAPPIELPVTPSLPPPSGPSVSAPARHTMIYRWTDEQGVVHFTDNSETVPPEYRGQAKQPPS